MKMMLSCIIFLHLVAAATSADDWVDAFSSDGEQQLVKGNLIATIPSMGKEWKVSFEINPTRYFQKLANILHLTTGGKGMGAKAKPGERIPAVWLHQNLGVIIAASLKGKATVLKKFAKSLVPINKWTWFNISQVKEGRNYMYKVALGGVEVLAMKNSQPEEFKNVKVFASNPWNSNQEGSIRNLTIETKIRVLCASISTSWSGWSAWSSCTGTCGQGERMKMRACPQSGACPGNSIITEECSNGVACQGLSLICISKNWAFFT